ncbi:MAG TPA: HYExAFE family protein [Lacipirellulaceae bacterium]|nr:HYExAFE family protein [Lacipirellulaceae bacterium]
MAKRDNHYEAAFEEYLRQRRVAYVAVDEQRRSQLGDGSLKNVDFLVSPADGATLLVDVKGRRFPSGQRSPQYWRNWTTWDDLRSLARWQDRLGEGSVALLGFVFHVVGRRAPLAPEQLFWRRDQAYGILAVRVADYIRFARPLSQKWQTAAMPAPLFRQAAVPFDEFLAATPVARCTPAPV